MEVETMVVVVTQEVICRFETPRALHSDPGHTFESRVMKEMTRVRWMDKTGTTPYHPLVDDQVERFNRTLAAMLPAVVAPDQKVWDDNLPFLTLAYQATPHPTTGYSQNLMMF